MLKWCPCLGWCLTDPASGGEAKVLLNPMTTPSYNVRRISSFGQTVINESGEEEEVLRHGTLPSNIHNGDGPPWLSNAIPVQPGVTKSDVEVRVKRMGSIPERNSSTAATYLKKRLSEADRYTYDSPLRTRKKIHTPEEFAATSYHNSDCDRHSVKSETFSEHGKNVEEIKSACIPDNSVPTAESIHTNIETEPKVEKPRSRSGSSGSLFNLVKAKTAISLDKPKSPKSPWMKKKSSDKPKSPLVKSKLSMETKDTSKENRVNDLPQVQSEEVIEEYIGNKDDIHQAGKVENFLDENEDDSESISKSPSQSTIPIGEEEMDEVTLDGSRSIDSVEIAKQYGLDLNLYDMTDTVGHGGSGDDNLSANVSIAKILFSVRVDKEKNQLLITIEKVEGLGGLGSKNIPFDLVVKLGFLKGGHVYSTKPSISSKPITQNFSLHVKDLATSILRLAVYNSAWQGTHDALGYSLFRINKCTQSITYHSLNVSPKSNITDSAGLIEVSFRFQSKILYVIVHKIFDILPAYRGYKVYTKTSLFISSKKFKEKISKTESCEKGYTMFDFESKFKADNITEQHTFVMISLKKKGDNNKLFKNDKTLGRIFLGPLFYTGNKINLWGQAILEEKIMTHTFSLYL